MRIGVLGGSFNPAHAGHLHISGLALRLLRLDQVWWLVSPQNPLKPTRGMATLEERLREARAVIGGDPRIIATAIEAELGTTYTVDTVRALKRRFPEHRLVWLMGADNLVQLPRWRHWRTLFRLVAIAVFDRPTYSIMAVNGKAARRFAGARIPERRAWRLVDMAPPVWVFLPGRLHAGSATAIRARRAAERCRGRSVQQK